MHVVYMNYACIHQYIDQDTDKHSVGLPGWEQFMHTLLVEALLVPLLAQIAWGLQV